MGRRAGWKLLVVVGLYGASIVVFGLSRGTIPAVVGGGAITILIALSWSRFFPALAEVDRLEQIRASPAGRELGELLA